MISIIPMALCHIDEVLAIEEQTFTIPWSRKDFIKELDQNKMAYYFVAVDEAAVIGYGGLWHVVNEGHITNIAVKEQYRRNGIGTLIVQKLLDLAKDKEMIGVTLEVKISNTPAQKLYGIMGFRPEGIRKNYYADTKEDAVIMWKYF